MIITNLEQVISLAQKEPPRKVAVAVAEQSGVMAAIRDSLAAGLVQPLLYGDREAIIREAELAGLDLAQVEICPQPDDLQAAAAAVRAVREGQAEILMKGHLHTDDFLRALLHKEQGLRSGSIMSHVFVMETPARGKLTLVTDGAMNIAPDLEIKAEIILNAVYLAHALGVSCPKVGVLAAVEVVNPAMPATVEAGVLQAMARRRQFPHCLIDGPLALDNALSPEAARVKGIEGEVAGECDILVCPDIEAGNILAKAFTFLAGGKVAGVLVGAAAPVVLTSRADSAEARFYSLALAVQMVHMQRDGRLKLGKVHY